LPIAFDRHLVPTPQQTYDPPSSPPSLGFKVEQVECRWVPDEGFFARVLNLLSHSKYDMCQPAVRAAAAPAR